MLLSFSVTNFRSFREEQTLNLLASKRLGAAGETRHCCKVPGIDEYALRVASLYGANGAGKSNLVRALSFLKRMVLNGTKRGNPISFKPFLLDHYSASEPTVLELQFIEQGMVFRYGVCFDSIRIHEEWLDAYDGKTERNVFSRSTAESENVKVKLGPAAKDSSDRIQLLAKVSPRPNQLFLTEIVDLDDPDSQGSHFRRVINWFRSSLTIIGPDSPFVSLARKIAQDETFAEFAGRFLRDASTGVADIKVQTKILKLADITTFPAEFLERLFDDLPQGEAVTLPGPTGEEITIEKTASGKVESRKIVAMHDNVTEKPTSFPLHEESDGTQRLLNLLPALHYLTSQDGVFVIDELERSMHPMLARKFVEFFLNAVPNAKSQLIFTTHESTLLDLDLMRRDGIWFSEKDKEGATHLYSLADFKVRNDLKIDKGYLAGRFGAIPFLGGIDRLIEEQTMAEAKK